ncbi:MAG: hypothetical protein ACR2OB_04570 [Solirubrobacteraceae bacterium]
MRRLPVAAFAALVVATVAAFFVTQHLKVTTPLIAGAPGPYPATISPRQTGCQGFHRRMMISFYLQHRADDVDVYIVDRSRTIIATLASGRHMRRGVRTPDGVFVWNGKQDDGAFAPDGTYYVRVDLIHQGRSEEISGPTGPKPLTVKTVPPRPIVTSVQPALIPQGSAPVAIHFRDYQGIQSRGATVRIYRTDLPGAPRLVWSFPATGKGQMESWDGRIGGRPAPAGTYLVGLDVTDDACNTGHFPPVLPPARGTTAHAGVTVRYLAAESPLDPVPAGTEALAYVDSRQRPYTWTLARAGSRASIVKGSARGSAGALRVRLPARMAGLYELSIRSGSQRTAVPVVADAASAPIHAARARSPRVLVVLPALTWQGLNPVDDDHDGIPNTLDGGGPILLHRPLADGLPTDLAGEAALLAYLDRAHLPYDLSTDVGLIDRTGPTLIGHSGVVLAGSERWLPDALGIALRSYAQQGGRVLSLGIDSLRRGVSLQETAQGPHALAPTGPAGTDALGARPGALVTGSPNLVTVLRDDLGIFSGTAGAFPGLHAFEPIPTIAPPAQILSAAGTSTAQPSIVGYRLGRGIVVEAGLPELEPSLSRNVDSQELVSRLWKVLSGSPP